MTKTNLALLVGGACAAALFAIGFELSTPRRPQAAQPDRTAGHSEVAWDQPPGIPPTGGGSRPKGIERPASLPV